MPTVNSSRIDRTAFAFGVLVCAFLHFAWLSSLPGLHFDEAWALNYAWRIAFEPGFWPWQGMTPYTSPWTHYWAALCLKTLGSSVSVFRASQTALGFGSILLASLFLRRAGRIKAAAWLPLMAALIPGLIFNHRFAIELNSFHPFVFMLFLLSLQRKNVLAAAFWCFLGCTAHILFYGVALGLMAAVLWEGAAFSRREKIAFSLLGGLLAIFLLRVAFLVPDRGKALALFLSTLALLYTVHFPKHLIAILRFAHFRRLPLLLASVFFLNLLFFAPGEWSLSAFSGNHHWRGLGLAGILLTAVMLAQLFYFGIKTVHPLIRIWLCFSLFFLGIMMLKPAPRYFELPLLTLLIVAAVGLVSLAGRGRVVFLLLLFANALPLYAAFFRATAHEENFQFLSFKDSSRDFLSKQKLAQFLGGSGCRFSDIKQVDSRVRESLLALSRTDWPVSENKCPWKDITVSQKTMAGGPGIEIADFILEGTAWQTTTPNSAP